MKEQRVSFVVPAGEAGMALSAFLRRRGVSLRTIRSLKYQQEGILVNGQRARTNQKLAADDTVELVLPREEGFSARPQDIPLEIIYHSQDALVVEKPAGMVVHPGPSYHSGTLANAVCGLLQQRGEEGVFRPVGRLDKNTSGLALCAVNAAVAPLLASLAQKTYCALVTGRLQQARGVISAPLGAQTGSAVAQQVKPDGRPSETEYEVLQAGDKASLVKVAPRSGRTHQIRVHFAHLGHPLLGDALYGGDMTLLKRHALHCAALCFEELCGNRPHLHSGLPQDMLAAALALGLDPLCAGGI